jgi:hypothetical protein
MKRLLGAALVAACFAILAPLVAFATDAAPETVAQATSETTKVTWAYGAAISQWASAASAIVFAVVAWALRLLPGQIYSVIVAMRADQLLLKAIDYAINMVQGASKDKSLTVDVQNAVLAKALQYVLDNAPGWLQQWMGGPVQIANKIIARLNIAPDAPPPSAVTAVVNTTPAA